MVAHFLHQPVTNLPVSQSTSQSKSIIQGQPTLVPPYQNFLKTQSKDFREHICKACSVNCLLSRQERELLAQPFIHSRSHSFTHAAIHSLAIHSLTAAHLMWLMCTKILDRNLHTAHPCRPRPVLLRSSRKRWLIDSNLCKHTTTQHAHTRIGRLTGQRSVLDVLQQLVRCALHCATSVPNGGHLHTAIICISTRQQEHGAHSGWLTIPYAMFPQLSVQLT